MVNPLEVTLNMVNPLEVALNIIFNAFCLHLEERRVWSAFTVNRVSPFSFLTMKSWTEENECLDFRQNLNNYYILISAVVECENEDFPSSLLQSFQSSEDATNSSAKGNCSTH